LLVYFILWWFCRSAVHEITCLCALVSWEQQQPSLLCVWKYIIKAPLFTSSNQVNSTHESRAENREHKGDEDALLLFLIPFIFHSAARKEIQIQSRHENSLCFSSNAKTICWERERTWESSSATKVFLEWKYTPQTERWTFLCAVAGRGIRKMRRWSDAAIRLAEKGMKLIQGWRMLLLSNVYIATPINVSSTLEVLMSLYYISPLKMQIPRTNKNFCLLRARWNISFGRAPYF
jgi:hypothetical protein